jgi:homogentisate 1,2-dioxygenase
MIYYVSGKFGSRRGVDVGSITLHPSGLPHGPQPGLAEKSIGTHETHELAVMCDTFYPLKLSALAKELDDGKYAYSWYENAEDGDGAEASVDGEGDASGAGLTSHF